MAVCAAVAVCAAFLVGAQFRARHPEGRGFGLAYLNWFDAYVYLAMAEHPPTFTVAPWGYRTLVPWLAHVGDARKPLRSLKAVTLVGLAAAGTLLVFFLRRRGFGWRAAALGLLAFSLSPPVGAALENPYVVDGVGVALAVAFLLALEHGAGLPALLLLLALGLQTKELFLGFLPLLVLPLRRRLSLGRSAVGVVALGLGAVALSAALRGFWTPHIATPHPALDGRLLDQLLADMPLSGPRAAVATLLAGLTPLALLGATRSAARPFLRRYGFLAALTFALPFFTWYNVPDTRAYGFFGDVPRLHIYALPFLIPLALIALARIWPSLGLQPGSAARAPAESRGGSRLATAFTLAALAGALAAPFLLADSYRRYPFHTRRDGLQILLACRHSLTVAGRLERGEAVDYPVLPAGSRARADGVAPGDPVPSSAPLAPEDPRRLRWFLVGPWSDAVYTGDDELRFGARTVSLLVPSFRAQALDVAVTLAAAGETPVEVELNGRHLATRVIAGEEPAWTLRLPAESVWRGDNVLSLAVRGGAGEVVIRRLIVRPQRPVPAG